MTPQFKIQIEDFIYEILEYIKSKNINLEDFEIDHVAYKNSSSAKYEEMRRDFEKEVFIYESIISNRRIAISKFREPVVVQNKIIKYIEIFEPKPDKATPDKLDHIEIIPKDISYEEFILLLENKGIELVMEDKGYDKFYAFDSTHGHEVKIIKERIVDKVYREEMR